MREVDIKCEGEIDKQGRCSITITVSNLTLVEATEISARAQAPFREIVMAVLGQGAKLESRDLGEKLQ